MKFDSPSRPSSQIHKMGAGFRNVGLIFAALGAAAILAPTIATLVVEQLVAWLLLFWGIAGLIFAFSFRGFSEWRFIGLFFFAVLIAGLGFIMFPGRGAAFLTSIMVIVFILDGVLSILLGLRLSGHVANWRWVIASGLCAFLIGLAILVQWPTTSTWILGFLTGLNFLSTGISMLLLSRTSGNDA